MTQEFTEQLREEVKREENAAKPLKHESDPDCEILKLRDSVRRHPNDGNEHNNLAAALAKRGDLQGAVEELRAARLLAPKNPVIKENYERLLQEVNRTRSSD